MVGRVTLTAALVRLPPPPRVPAIALDAYSLALSLGRIPA